MGNVVNENNINITLEPFIEVRGYVETTTQEVMDRLRDPNYDGSIYFIPQNWTITEEVRQHINYSPQMYDMYEPSEIDEMGVDEVMDHITDELFTSFYNKKEELSVNLPKYKTDGTEYTKEDHKKMVEIHMKLMELEEEYNE